MTVQESVVHSSWRPDDWRERPVGQPISWPDAGEARRCIEKLSGLPPLVFAGEIRRLRAHVAAASRGEAFVLVAGDCAESMSNLSANRVRDQLRILLQMALVLSHGAGLPVVKVGRMAGQFAKPRSAAVETLPGGSVVPTFRGHLVNSEFADVESRSPDPQRLIQGYHFATSVLNLLRAFTTGGYAELSQVHVWNQEFVARSPAGKRYEAVAQEVDRAMRFLRACGGLQGSQAFIEQTEFFTAHEALVLDYESPLTRRDSLTSDWYGCSAHMLWIGERTRQLGGAHVEYARGIHNPIGIKLSDRCTPEELVELCRVLDPRRTPGRLILMSRMGADSVRRSLPGLMAAVSQAEHPVLWMCDPMHGNTVTTASGLKTRDFDAVMSELVSFIHICRAQGVAPGGVHLEMTPEDVTECTGGSWATSVEELSTNYQSLCDPRLNGTQSLDLAFLLSEHLRGSACS